MPCAVFRYDSLHHLKDFQDLLSTAPTLLDFGPQYARFCTASSPAPSQRSKKSDRRRRMWTVMRKAPLKFLFGEI